MKETIEHNNRFYGEELKTESEQLKEWLIVANKEIERLTELCNKYEEEHNTTFETWQKDIKENDLLHSIIKEVREYIKKEVNVYYVLDTKINEAFDKTNKVKEDILEILDKENI